MLYPRLPFTKLSRFFVPLVALLLAMMPVGVARSNNKGTGAHESAAILSEQSFWSPSLEQDMPFAVYLPPGYVSNPNQHYPVLYMLHGLGGDHDQWRNDGLFDAATQMIQSGAIEPMIIITPEGQAGYWMDHAGGGPLYGSYVTSDLVSMIDTRYRTIPQRQARAIGGMSMGAHGALQLALNHPDEFSIVGAHSLALRDQSNAFDYFGTGADFAGHDPVSLCKLEAATARSLTLWIDVGTGDPWSVNATKFHQQLTTEQIPHTWHLNPGAHDDVYWRAHVHEYLAYYGRSFAKNLGHGTRTRPRGYAARNASVTAS